MNYFKECNKIDRSPCPQKNYGPLNLPKFHKMSFFEQLMPLSGGIRSCIDKAELKLNKQNKVKPA